MRRYLAEGIGTFALVFCGTGAIAINEITNGAVSHVGIAITFGLIVMAMIYALGDISGAHLNPAVSFAFLTQKKLTVQDFFAYCLSQFIGAMMASGILRLLFPNSTKLGATIPAGSEWQSFILELILTFFLLFTIGALSKKENSMMAGWVIGSVVLLEALFAGPISGASMNPVRSLAPAIWSNNVQSLWIYLTAPFIGAYLGILLSDVLERKPDHEY